MDMSYEREILRELKRIRRLQTIDGTLLLGLLRWIVLPGALLVGLAFVTGLFFNWI